MSKKVDLSYHFCVYCGAKYTLLDAMNNPWCDAHKLRHDLMNWGKEHGWPEIHCIAPEETVDLERSRYRHYAVGGEYALWFTACSLGSDHFMDTLSATVFASGQEDS